VTRGAHGSRLADVATPSGLPTAQYRPRAVLLGGMVLAGACAAWALHHALGLTSALEGHGSEFYTVFFLAFLLLVWQTVLCFLERPYVVTCDQRAALARRRVVVNVPCYNEDPDALRACLASMLHQTRPPDLVHVVDDGSSVDYAAVRRWFERSAARAGVPTRWSRQPNAGKRRAQGVTVAGTPDADFYVTVDSDAVLDPHAIEEGLKPFADPRVQSVAGVVMLTNLRRNLLTRATELWFVVGQLIDRSAMSTMGGVLVNSGALAFYRGELLRRHLDGYLNESFFGRAVELSDDSMLTIYALTEGRAVQQPTAFAFTLMPDRYDHHRRQYVRWMRGAFIRSWWRFRYLPLGSYAYWNHLLGWVQLALSTATFLTFFVYVPIAVDPGLLPYFLVVPLLVGYGQGLRYFVIRRADVSLAEQVQVYLLTPVVALYSFFVLRVLRYYAIATCLRTGWGTRAQVEVRSGAVSAGSPARRTSRTGSPQPAPGPPPRPTLPGTTGTAPASR
jgi:hyaluronan synthase